jgi:hypothetical protein
MNYTLRTTVLSLLTVIGLMMASQTTKAVDHCAGVLMEGEADTFCPQVCENFGGWNHNSGTPADASDICEAECFCDSIKVKTMPGCHDWCVYGLGRKYSTCGCKDLPSATSSIQKKYKTK